MPQARRKSTETSGVVSTRFKELGAEVAVIVSVFVALYSLLSLLTYSPSDPGWSHSGSAGAVTNYGGRLGANFSDVLLHGFGYMSFLVPIMVLVIGVRFYKSRNLQVKPSFVKRVIVGIGFVITILGGCGLENLHFNYASETKPFLSGGYLGDWVSGQFVSMFGSIGCTLLLVTFFLTGITMFTGLSWLGLMDLIGEKVFVGVEYLNNLREEKADKAIGEQARIERQGSVGEIRKKLQLKKEPKIEPRVQVSATEQDSGRMEREKQTSLFEPMNGGDSVLPPLSLLEPAELIDQGYSDEELKAMSTLLVKKLADFNIEAEVVSVHQGPVITRFEINPAPGVKAAQITSLAKDLARAMSTVSVRVVENIPGKSVIGIEIPNERRETVRLIEGLSSREYEDINSPLALVLGKNISGGPVIADLAKMPHLLIAGTTGSGKSVCINALILSIIYKATAKEVRMIMVDPKMLELSVYEGIPHLLAPVVTDMNEAANALRWSIVEMERRYKLMSELGVRNLAGYNRKIKMAVDMGEPIMDPTTAEGQIPEPLQELPCLVVVIDELADLMMVVGKKVEELITRLAQKGRASGVHLLLATQRPSVDVITGLLKANIPTRIAFQVSSKVDSRTVLDQMGAEQLLGHGDMLYLPPGTSLPIRVHGSFVSDQEVHKIVDYLKQSGVVEYDEDVISGPREVNDALPPVFQGESSDPEDDPLYDQAVELVTTTRRVSISSVQRHLRVGYNRAARMVESMEAAGVVGPMETNGKREVLAPASGRRLIHN